MKAVCLAVPSTAVVAAAAYCLAWVNARDPGSPQWDNRRVEKVLEEFRRDVSAGQLDDAYELTTEAFRKRVSREAFAELARQYRRHYSDSHAHTGSSGSAGPDYLVDRHVNRDAEGRSSTLTIAIRRDKDSIFKPRPPRLGVDEFRVE
jgi:hypothetical protein